MRKILFGLAIFLSHSAWAETEAQLIKGAMFGDLGRQQNLAYSYSTGWKLPGDKDYVPKNPVAACAWARVIILGRSKDLMPSDYSNEWTFCKIAGPAGSEEAWKTAFKLNVQIHPKAKK